MVFLKTIFIFLVTALVYVFLGNNFNQEIIIPKESIRFRIIADDNTEASEEIKFKIKMLIELELSEILDEKDNFLSSKVKIENSLKSLENKVNSMLKKEKILESVQISYGSHFFPEKFYNGVKYESGFYESLVVILGNGLGNNWWCIVYPPLCFVNKSDLNEHNIQYQSYLVEIIRKHFKG